MSNLINGRTPEEIKKALRLCNTEGRGHCKECPYNPDCYGQPGTDALAYIECLEEKTSRFNGLLATLIDTMNALASAQPKWISVKDRLPEAFQCVIVHVRHTKKWRDKELDPSKWWRAVEEDCWSGVGWCGNADEDIHEVTHWMPLPEPPEVEE